MVSVSLQEEFSPALHHPVQNLAAPSGWCEYGGVSHGVGFGMREAQMLFPSETGSTAVHRRGPATHPPTHHPQPRAPPCQVGGEWISLSIGWWCCLVHGDASTSQQPAGCPSQKALLITPLLSSLTQGNWGKAPAVPSLPSLPPPLARQTPAALPCVHRAGLIRDVLMMNASSWNCGSCLSGMMQLRKNVKYLSWFTAGNSASN